MENNLTKIDYGGIIDVDQGKIVAAFTKEKGLDDFLVGIKETLEKEKDALSDDLSKVKNRKAYRSLGAKVGSLKAGLEKTAKALIEARQEAIKNPLEEIDIIRKVKKDASDLLKNLRVEMASPAVEWEAAENLRQDEIKARIAEIRDYMNASDVDPKILLDHLQRIEIDETFAEFKEEAQVAKDSSEKYLKMAIEIDENKKAEAARLKKEKADQEAAAQKERDDKIRRDAEEKAERDGIAREKKLEEDRLREKIQREEEAVRLEKATEQRIIEISNLAMAPDGINSEGIRARLEILARMQINKNSFGERCGKALVAQASAQKSLEERLKITTKEELAEEEAKAGLARRVAKKEAADVLAREEEKKKKETAQRAADADHTKKIDGEIMADLIALKFEKQIAAKLLFHIKMGDIENVRIEY